MIKSGSIRTYDFEEYKFTFWTIQKSEQSFNDPASEYKSVNFEDTDPWQLLPTPENDAPWKLSFIADWFIHDT